MAAPKRSAPLPVILNRVSPRCAFGKVRSGFPIKCTAKSGDARLGIQRSCGSRQATKSRRRHPALAHPNSPLQNRTGCAEGSSLRQPLRWIPALFAPRRSTREDDGVVGGRSVSAGHGAAMTITGDGRATQQNATLHFSVPETVRPVFLTLGKDVAVSGSKRNRTAVSDASRRREQARPLGSPLAGERCSRLSGLEFTDL
jgi:hypothetical protein